MPFTTFYPLPSRPTCPPPLLPTCGDTFSQQLRAASQWCAGSVQPSRDDPTLWHLAITPGCPPTWSRPRRACPELAARRHWQRRAGPAARLTTAARVTERRTAHKYSKSSTANDLPAESSHREGSSRSLPFMEFGRIVRDFAGAMETVDQLRPQVTSRRIAARHYQPGIGQPLTDELVLAIAISAPWLSSYFHIPSQGGGG